MYSNRHSTGLAASFRGEFQIEHRGLCRGRRICPHINLVRSARCLPLLFARNFEYPNSVLVHALYLRGRGAGVEIDILQESPESTGVGKNGARPCYVIREVPKALSGAAKKKSDMIFFSLWNCISESGRKARSGCRAMIPLCASCTCGASDLGLQKKSAPYPLA